MTGTVTGTASNHGECYGAKRQIGSRAAAAQPEEAEGEGPRFSRCSESIEGSIRRPSRRTLLGVPPDVRRDGVCPTDSWPRDSRRAGDRTAWRPTRGGAGVLAAAFGVTNEVTAVALRAKIPRPRPPPHRPCPVPARPCPPPPPSGCHACPGRRVVRRGDCPGGHHGLRHP